MKQQEKGKRRKNWHKLKTGKKSRTKVNENNPRYQAILGFQPSHTGVWARITLEKHMTVKATSHKRRKMFLTWEKHNICKRMHVLFF